MKFKLISTISAFVIMTVGTVSIIPTLLSSNNYVVNQTNQNTEMIITNNIKHSSNIQALNSINEVNIEKTNTNFGSSYAIVNNNGKQEIYVWGKNNRGQLGLNDTNDRMTPSIISPKELGDYFFIKEFYMLSGSTVAIVSTAIGEQIYVWGQNDLGQLGIGNSVDQIKPILFNTSIFGEYKSIKEFKIVNAKNAEGNHPSSHAILETENGREKIFVWGDNSSYKLGINNEKNYTSPIEFSTSLFGSDFKSILKMEFSAPNSFAIIETTTNKRKIFFWGSNFYKQIRNTSETAIINPLEIVYPFFNNAKIKDAGAGLDAMYIILTRNGVDELYVSGWNEHGFLGIGNNINQNTMVQMPQSHLGGATEIMDVSIMVNCYAKVKINGEMKIYVWGKNDQGQLGIGKEPSDETVNKPVEFKFSSIGSPLEIYSSSFDSSNLTPNYSRYAYVRLKSTDAIYVWGGNSSGQLGTKDNLDKMSPVSIKDFDLKTNKIKSFKFYDKAYSFITLESNGKNQYFASGESQNGAFGNGFVGKTLSFIEILKNRYTKPNLIDFNSNLTANEALDKINPKNSLDLLELNKYIDTSSFPKDAILSIDNKFTTVDHENGVINLAINTNKYYELFVSNAIVKNKNFNIVLNGFKKANDIEVNPVTVNNFAKTDDLTIDEWHKKLVDIDSKVINRELLSDYLNLNAIPDSANIYLHRTTFNNKKQAQFSFKSNQVYSNDGRVVDRLYEVPNLSIELSSTTEKPVDIGLIVGLTIGGLALVAIVIFSIILYKKYNLQKQLVGKRY